jgi:hypothetical protein
MKAGRDNPWSRAQSDRPGRAGPHTGKLNDVFGVARFLPTDGASCVERNVAPVPTFPRHRGTPIHPGLCGGPIFGAPACLANLSVRDREFGDQVPDGVSKWLPCWIALHPQRMEQQRGKVRAEGNSKISGA